MKKFYRLGGSRCLRWLNLALGRDQTRPMLTAYHRQHDALVAGDGYRLHAVPAEKALPAESDLLSEAGENTDTASSMTITGTLTDDSLVMIEPFGIKFPDVQGIVQGDITAEFHVQAKFLKDALCDMTGEIRVALHAVHLGTPVIEVFGQDAVGVPMYAIIALIDNRFPSPGWRPGGGNGAQRAEV